jgi:beta propeller repeat protein
MRRRLFLMLFVGAVLFALPSGAAGAQELNVKEHQITVSSANETTPTLGNDGISDLVVYTMRVVLPDHTLAPGDIWYQRVTPDGAPTGPAVQVTAEPTDDELNDVSGDYIVYTAYDSTSSMAVIMLYRISTYQLAPLAQAVVALEPRIYGNNVVWVQGPSGATQIMWYELGWLGTAREARQVAGPVPPATEVAIGSNYIAWTQRSGGQADVWAFDLVNASRVPITMTPGIDETQPATSGPWITWQTQRQGANSVSIEAMNPSTWDVRSVVINDAFNMRPSIDGDLIAWESTVTGNYDIFLYRLSDSLTFQVTTDPADQYLNDVFGNKVAFVDLRNGSQDIYLASFNMSPWANAGAAQTVHAGSLVTLDGSDSTDPDLNYPLTYAWAITQKPAGSAAALSGAGTATPSFTADVMGDYVAELVVTDAEGWASVPDMVMVSTMNTAPVAAAGPDQSLVLLGSTVQLDGSTSYDPDGDAIAYLWSFTSRPGESAAVLSDPTAAKPTFVADLYGKYDLSLTVTDPFGAGASDAVAISFENVKPVANAGVNQTVVAPSTVWLNGAASNDANGDPLTCQWNMVSRPDGSSAVLSNSETANPSFVADLAGQYVVSLVVSDGLLASDPSNVTITATSGSTAVIDVLRDTVNVINGLPPASFKNPNMANALTNKIAAMIQMIERGNYAEALDKVKNDILAKTNGCAAAGAPDKNDWITDCAAQAQVYPYLIEVMTMLQQMVP